MMMMQISTTYNEEPLLGLILLLLATDSFHIYFVTIFCCIFSILKFFHTTSDEYTVIFTSGATDSIRRVGEWFDYGREGGRLCYLRDNHTSVLGVREYALQRSVTVHCVTETDLQLDSAQIDDGGYSKPLV